MADSNKLRAVGALTVPLIGITQAGLLFFKAVGALEWGWPWILFPIWGPAAILLAVLVSGGAIYISLDLLSSFFRKLGELSGERSDFPRQAEKIAREENKKTPNRKVVIRSGPENRIH
jgi:hypothetical protein